MDRKTTNAPITGANERIRAAAVVVVGLGVGVLTSMGQRYLTGP